MRDTCITVLHRLSWFLLGSAVPLIVLTGGNGGLVMMTSWLLVTIVMAERMLWLRSPGAYCDRCGKWLFFITVLTRCKACTDQEDDARDHCNGNCLRRLP